jgi:hypothetical protein
MGVVANISPCTGAGHKLRFPLADKDTPASLDPNGCTFEDTRRTRARPDGGLILATNLPPREQS